MSANQEILPIAGNGNLDEHETTSVYWADELAERAVRAIETLVACDCLDPDSDSSDCLVEDVRAFQLSCDESGALDIVKEVCGEAIDGCLQVEARRRCPSVYYALLSVYWAIDD
nr:MAG TPA: hypothetical protein [Caudoviricetes sp.]